MLATQKGRSKPVRISCKRSEKVKVAPDACYISIRIRTSFADSPVTRIILCRLVSPDAMVTEERETSKRFAKNSMQASFARPSIGGAVKASLKASPTSPVIAFLLARGCTLTAKVTPADESRIGIIDCDITTELQRHRELQQSDLVEQCEPTGTSLAPQVILLDFLCDSVSRSNRPFAENRRPHAHACRPFFDRDFEIVRHAHRKRVHINALQPAGSVLVAQFTQLSEIGPRLFGIFCPGWDCH